jgi:hypothetical protein
LRRDLGLALKLFLAKPEGIFAGSSAQAIFTSTASDKLFSRRAMMA